MLRNLFLISFFTFASTALAAPEPDRLYDPNQDPSGGDVSTPDSGVNLSSGALPVNTDTGSAYEAYGQSWEFNGAESAFYPDYVSGDTQSSVSFEIWFKPNDVSGQQVILDAGGATDGASLTINNGTLQLTAKDDGFLSQVTADLGDYDTTDFLQLTGVIDLDTDELTLYINGEEVDSDSYTGNDWAGTNDGGLGNTFGGETGGNLAGYGFLDGEIASFAIFYDALTAQDVADRFDLFAPTAVPEPGSIACWLVLASMAGVFYVRRRSRRKV